MSLDLTLSRTGLGYILSVTDTTENEEALRFEVQSVVKNSWGINGRVTVRSRIETARTVPSMRNGYVTTERLDFLSGKSRQMFAERLATLIPSPPNGASMDWGVLVEELVARVMDAEHRQPVMRMLPDVPPTPRTPHLIPFLLPDGKATILYGAGGTGKSILATGIAAAVQNGAMFLGWQCAQRNVLYLDWETDEGDLSHRNAVVSKGLRLSAPAKVRYMSLELPLELEMAHIAAAVVENEIGLVIIDSVGMASTQGRDGSDPAEAAIQFFRALRMLNAAVLCIDHISGEDQRRGRAGASKPYGSVFKWNSARNAFELLDATEEDGPPRLILRHRKANLGPRMNDVTLAVRWDDDIVTFRRVIDTTPTTPLSERVLGLLSTGPASYRNLQDLLNSDQRYDATNEAAIREASRPLILDNIINVDHAGVLRIAAKDDDEETDAETVALDL